MANQGRRKEREFIKEMADEGVPIVKMPSSGSGTSRELPDFMMRLNGKLMAGEHKYSNSSDYLYMQSEKIEDLEKFCDDWKAEPVVVGRWANDTNHYLMSLKGTQVEEEKTPSGNVSMKKSNRGKYHVVEEMIDDEIL